MFFWDVNISILEKRPLRCFKTSGTTHPGTGPHIPEKRRPLHSSNTSVGHTLCHRTSMFSEGTCGTGETGCRVTASFTGNECHRSELCAG